MTKIEILELAKLILEDIPREFIDLKGWVKEPFNFTRSMKVYCSGTHLAITKEFNDLGLYVNFFGCPVYVLNGEAINNGSKALSKVFMDGMAFEKYFAPRLGGIWDRSLITDEYMSDKSLSIARLDKGIQIESTLRTL